VEETIYRVFGVTVSVQHDPSSQRTSVIFTSHAPRSGINPGGTPLPSTPTTGLPRGRAAVSGRGR
jgi:hypothetical protein